MKTTLYLDFDSTLVHSDKAFCDAYNVLYANYTGFTPADHELATDWVFKSACPLIHTLHQEPYKAVMSIFGSDAFFEALSFFPHALEAVKVLSQYYSIVICTSASPVNGSKKLLWIEKNLPMVDEIIVLINHKKQGVGKGRIAMLDENAIFVDDHPENLHSTKASRKILFEARPSEYSESWKGEKYSDWESLKAVLIKVALMQGEVNE